MGATVRDLRREMPEDSSLAEGDSNDLSDIPARWPPCRLRQKRL
jgi:hypothetical protein